MTVTQRQLDELTIRLGRAEDELAAAARREAALEQRVLEQLGLIGRLERLLSGMEIAPTEWITAGADEVLAEARAAQEAA